MKIYQVIWENSMSSKERKSSIDPVVIVTLGLVLLAIAFVLIALRPNVPTINADSGTWSQLVVAFITGITTGGLSCLAVQGGLLASSPAHQVELGYVEHAGLNKKARQKTSVHTNSAFSIFPFLTAKIIAYTLLCALPGAPVSDLTV